MYTHLNVSIKAPEKEEEMLKSEILCSTLMSLYGGGRRELRSCSRASLVSR